MPYGEPNMDFFGGKLIHLLLVEGILCCAGRQEFAGAICSQHICAAQITYTGYYDMPVGALPYYPYPMMQQYVPAYPMGVLRLIHCA